MISLALIYVTCTNTEMIKFSDLRHLGIVWGKKKKHNYSSE